MNWLAATDKEYGGMEVVNDTHSTAQLYNFVHEL